MSKLLKEKVRERLMREYYELSSDKTTLKENDLNNLISRIFHDMRTYEKIEITEAQQQDLTRELIDELIGFGLIEKLLRDPTITEIMINGPQKIYVERNGNTELTNISFEDERQLMHIIQKILLPTRRRVDELLPYTDVRLSDGSRVNIIIPPVSLIGPVVTIRKFSKEIKRLEDLIRLGTLDKRMGDFLIAAIKAKVNIIFSGATGAGKTTTLNVLSSYISKNERIITIEDTSELTLNQEHWVPLEAKQANIEGKGEITIRDLFKNTLRMRPERIIIGEIRGGEALDMLQAISSGHKGSLAVIHADSPQDVIYRLETMILTTEEAIGLESIKMQIASALDIIVQQEQIIDGTRKITHIAEVRGLSDSKEVIVEDIFTYDIEGIDAQGKVMGRWKASGLIPLFYPELKKIGIDLPQEIFNKD